MDLSLVPIKDIIKEIENRSEMFVCCYCSYESGNRIVSSHWTDNYDYPTIIGLCDIVKKEIHNEKDYIDNQDKNKGE